jgi:hypothetical protein
MLRAYPRHTILNTIVSKGYIPIVNEELIGQRLGIGYTMNPYMHIGASEKEYSEL